MAVTIGNKKYLKEGGPNSGNYGHAGRPGEQGGSGPGGGGWQSRRGVEGIGTQKGRNIIAAKAREHRKNVGAESKKYGLPTRISNVSVRTDIERNKYRMAQAQALKALRKAGFRTGTVPGSSHFAISIASGRLGKGKYSGEMFKFGRPGAVGGVSFKNYGPGAKGFGKGLGKATKFNPSVKDRRLKSF